MGRFAQIQLVYAYTDASPEVFSDPVNAELRLAQLREEYGPDSPYLESTNIQDRPIYTQFIEEN